MSGALLAVLGGMAITAVAIGFALAWWGMPRRQVVRIVGEGATFAFMLLALPWAIALIVAR